MSGNTLRIQTAEKFVPFLQPSRYKAAYGGRGSGKSHEFAQLGVERGMLHRGKKGHGLRMVCVREVQKVLRESVKLLLEDKIRKFGLESRFYYQIFRDHIVTPSGGVTLFQGMSDHTAESIKSLEGFDIGYVEEAQTLTARSLELLRPTIRSPGSELWFSWNPRDASDPVDQFFRGGTPPPDSIIVRANYMDNPWFPAELEAERAFDEINNPHRYGHIWLGEYEPQAIGAIWTREVIHRTRVTEAPKMKRILVGLDPPTTHEPGSDEAGITVGGLGTDDQGYLLDDVSTQGSPKQWADRAIAAYDLYEADAIVAEVNQGGDMVANTIHTIRPNIRVIEVRATRGKHVRAEPISALYAVGKIHHVGAHPKLEAQMCLMTAEGYQGTGSPDRVDSMVWIFTELFPKMTRRQVPKGQALPARANSRYNVHRAN